MATVVIPIEPSAAALAEAHRATAARSFIRKSQLKPGVVGRRTRRKPSVAAPKSHDGISGIAEARKSAARKFLVTFRQCPKAKRLPSKIGQHRVSGEMVARIHYDDLGSKIEFRSHL
jgi:hypothetical protein